MSLSPVKIVTIVGMTVWASAVLPAQRTARQPPPAPRSAAPAPPRVERPTPFKVGETLTYDVSWSTYLTAGTVVATVKEKRPSYDSTAYYIVAEGRPTPLLSKLYSLYYKMDTLIDVYTLLPQRGSIYSEEGGRHRFGTTTFDRRRQKGSFEYRTESIAKSEFELPPYAQDALSALYVMRAVSMKAGDRMTMPVSNRGDNYKAQFVIAGPEPVKVPFGEVSAWKVNTALYDGAGRPVGRNISIWLSADRRQLPVKVSADLRIGSFVLSLRAVK